MNSLSLCNFSVPRARFLALFLTGAGLLLLLGTASVQAQETKPNILFIAIDDLNDWVGPLGGHPLAKTPAMDKLAARGVTFTNAHCQAPLCNPSRTSLMTGLRPGTTGIYGLKPWFREVEALKDIVSLPQYLEKHGYRTYTAGKIFHGGYGRGKNDHEWNEIGPPASVGARPKEKLVQTPAEHKLVDWGVFPHKDEEKGDWTVASWGVEQIEKGPQQPFFLSVGFFLPHVPCYATQKWFDLYPDNDSIRPEVLPDDRADTPRFSWYLHWKLPEPRLKFLKEADQWNNLVRSYLACISFVDSQVGRVMDALENSSYQDNTIVVLWSDHGWHLGEKEITGKNTLWDCSTRVPLIFAGPGIVKGEDCVQPAELLDIYPTLLELAGLPPNEVLQGHSLVPQLKDPATEREWPAITTHNHDNHGVRTVRWRFIQYADGTEELYDMEADPNEFKNLAGDPAYLDTLKELRQWLPESNVPPAPNSAARVLTYDKATGETIWEGEEIKPTDPIPEL